MHLFNLCLFLAAGSTEEDVKNIALDLMVEGVRSFHMSKNNDYIIVFGYESKDYSEQFSKINGVSSVFMQPRDPKIKENSKDLIEEFINEGKRIEEPKILKTSKNVIDMIPELSDMYIRKDRRPHNQGCEPLRLGWMSGIKDKIADIKERDINSIKKDVDLITPEIWRSHFSAYAAKNSLQDNGFRSAHPRLVLNTYLVYLNTRSWTTTYDIIVGQLGSYASTPATRNSIERWFQEGVLDGLMGIYKSLSFEE